MNTQAYYPWGLMLLLLHTIIDEDMPPVTRPDMRPGNRQAIREYTRSTRLRSSMRMMKSITTISELIVVGGAFLFAVETVAKPDNAILARLA